MLLLYVINCGILFTGIIEQRDSLPLLKLIDSIGDWPIASDDWNISTGRNTSKPHSNYIYLVCPAQTGKRAWNTSTQTSTSRATQIHVLTQRLCSYICTQ